MISEKLKTVRSFYMATKPGFNELHSVHSEGCPFLPIENKRIFLGKFMSVSEARHEGNKYYSNSCGCRFCTVETGGSNKKNTENFDMEMINLRSPAFLKYLN